MAKTMTKAEATKLEEGTIIRKWYVEVTKPVGGLSDDDDDDEDYILQTDFFDTREEALEWGKTFVHSYINNVYIGDVYLMYSDGEIDEDGEWGYGDIDMDIEITRKTK